MLPVELALVHVVGAAAEPAWVGSEDHVWLRALIDDFRRLGGRPWREVSAFLAEPSRVPAPMGKRRMAAWTLERLCDREDVPLDAATLRERLFLAAQRGRDVGTFDRAAILAEAGGEDLVRELFSDLPAERRMRLPDPLPDVHDLAIRTNLALAQGLLRVASSVTVDLHGGARAVVRQIHLRRLLCTVRRADGDGVHIEVSGAFTLFRHTTLYGRALASILPLLCACERYDLVAACELRGREVSVRLRTGDPIATGDPPRQFDSRLEERFARDFTKATLDWDLVREPEPVEAGSALIFPDFLVAHRRDRTRRFLLEIVGFWTPEYLRSKLERLRAMPTSPLVLCIDRARNCGADELPPHASVVWFEKRIDPLAVLAAIEATPPARVPERIGLGDLFIDWAGRKPADDHVHRRLAELAIGSELRLTLDGSGLAVRAESGPVAMLSGPGRARWQARLAEIVSARLVGKVARSASQSGPAYRQMLRCERWELPLIEVIVR